MTTDTGAFAPKYHRIADALRRKVQAGELTPGDQLPAETAIAAEYETSVPTVRQAMTVLRAERIVESRHGIGTFVRKDQRLQRRSRNRYGEARGRDGLLTNSLRHEITDVGTIKVPERIASAMTVKAGTRVVVRRRYLYDEATGKLEEIGASYLPLGIARGTYLEKPAVVPKALFRCVEELTGRRYAHARDQWTPRPAQPDEARAFDLALGAYVLHVIHTATDEEGDVLEVSESIWPADRLTFIDEYAIPDDSIDDIPKSQV